MKDKMKRGISLIEILFIISIIVLAVAIVLPMFPQPDRVGPIGMTQANMRRIKMCVGGFYSEAKGYPDLKRWKDQLSPNYGTALEDCWNDSWDNSIVYCQDEKGDYYLYSFGKDGEDNSMSGDDIVLRVGTNGKAPDW